MTVDRGIDIDDILCVINYDVPHDAEDYVHRIGRTARAQRDGIAITFVSDMDMRYFSDIERFLEHDIEKRALPEGIGEGPVYQPTTPRKNSRGRGGRRRGDEGRKHDRGGRRQHKGHQHNKTSKQKPQQGN